MKGQLPRELFCRTELDGKDQLVIAGHTVEEAMSPDQKKARIGRYVLVESFWAAPSVVITGRISHEICTKRRQKS